MLYGSFGTHNGEPNLDAYLVLPQLGASGQVNFLVDTGAAITCLHPNDLLALGADLEAVRALPTLSVSGVGGSPNVYQTPWYVAFGDATASMSTRFKFPYLTLKTHLRWPPCLAGTSCSIGA